MNSFPFCRTILFHSIPPCQVQQCNLETDAVMIGMTSMVRWYKYIPGFSRWSSRLRLFPFNRKEVFQSSKMKLVDSLDGVLGML